MNHPKLTADASDDARFDRLVDGELSPEEYLTFLATLDDEPGGWRRCALAFLEAQSLHRELGVIRRATQISEPAAVSTVVVPLARQSGWKLLLAMAASFLVAFGLGVYLPALWRFPAHRPLAGPALQSKSPAALPPTEVPPVQPSSRRGIVPVGNVRLVVDGPNGTASDAGELPIYEMNDETARWLQQDQPAIPRRYVEELERRGHRVERQREYMQVHLDDGRQVIVPVEGYQITPAPRQSY